MNRDLIAWGALCLILLLCFPLLVLLAGDVSPTSIAQAFATATPTPAPRVYLLPFRQVFAIGEAQPLASAPFRLYESGTDVFRLIGQQDAFAHLQTPDGRMDFWTAWENVAMAPPAPAEYDFGSRGQTIRLAPATGYACLHTDAPPPVFSDCQPLANFSTAQLIARITSDSVTLYLIEVEGKHYFVPPEVVLTPP